MADIGWHNPIGDAEAAAEPGQSGTANDVTWERRFCAGIIGGGPGGGSQTTWWEAQWTPVTPGDPSPVIQYNEEPTTQEVIEIRPLDRGDEALSSDDDFLEVIPGRLVLKARSGGPTGPYLGNTLELTFVRNESSLIPSEEDEEVLGYEFSTAWWGVRPVAVTEATGLVIPTDLPDPLISGYGMTPEKALERTSYEAGVPRHRTMWSEPPEVLTLTWLLKRPQKAIFQDWYDSTLQGGTRKFDLQVKGQSENSWWVAQFIDNPWTSEVVEYNLLRVSARVLLEGPPTAERDLNLNLGMDLAGTVTTTMNLTVIGDFAMDLAGTVTATMVLTALGGISMDMAGTTTADMALTSDPTIRMNLAGTVTATMLIGTARDELDRVWMGLQWAQNGSSVIELDEEARRRSFMKIGKVLS